MQLSPQIFYLYNITDSKCTKAAGVKVYQRQTWNFRSHAVSACIGLWCHRPMHACTACIAPWHYKLMHAVTAQALLFWFCLGIPLPPATLEMYGLHRKLKCLSKLRNVTDTNSKTLAYYKICPFTLYYKSIIVYNTGHQGIMLENILRP